MRAKSFDSYKYREVWICTKRSPAGAWLDGKAVGFCRSEVAEVIEKLGDAEKFRFASLSTSLTNKPELVMEPFLNDRIEILALAGV